MVVTMSVLAWPAAAGAAPITGRIPEITKPAILCLIFRLGVTVHLINEIRVNLVIPDSDYLNQGIVFILIT